MAPSNTFVQGGGQKPIPMQKNWKADGGQKVEVPGFLYHSSAKSGKIVLELEEWHRLQSTGWVQNPGLVNPDVEKKLAAEEEERPAREAATRERAEEKAAEAAAAEEKAAEAAKAKELATIVAAAVKEATKDLVADNKTLADAVKKLTAAGGSVKEDKSKA